MSDVLEKVGRHPAGYWSFAAAKLVEDIRAGVTTFPKPFQVCSASYRDMREFFNDVRRTLDGEDGSCQGSYRLAMRALGFCLDNPFLIVDGKVSGIGTLEEADTKIIELLKLFYERHGDKKEALLELANFLERVYRLDEADMLAANCGHPIVGSITRFH